MASVEDDENDFAETRADFVIQWHQLLWFKPQFKAISECRNSLNQ